MPTFEHSTWEVAGIRRREGAFNLRNFSRRRNSADDSEHHVPGPAESSTGQGTQQGTRPESQLRRTLLIDAQYGRHYPAFPVEAESRVVQNAVHARRHFLPRVSKDRLSADAVLSILPIDLWRDSQGI